MEQEHGEDGFNGNRHMRPLWRENPGFGIWFPLFGFRSDSAFSSFELGFLNLETSK